MWGDPSNWTIGSLEGGAEPGAVPQGEARPVVPVPLDRLAVPDGCALPVLMQGSTPLLHPAPSAPAPASWFVPDGPAAAATLGAFPPRPAQPAASAPLPWLPPSPFDTAALSDVPTLRPTASAPLPALSPFSSGGYDSTPVGDGLHTLQPATLGPLQPALCGLSSGGFASVTSPQQLALPRAASPALLSLPPDGLGGRDGMHQPMPAMPPQRPPSPHLSAVDAFFEDDSDPLLLYLLEEQELAGGLSPLQPAPAGPPAPRPLGPAACLAAAVLARRPKVVRRLLAAGTPPNFRLSELPPADVAALEVAGMPLAGYQHMTPLMVAVRQLSTDVAAELLQGGAATRVDAAAGGIPSPRSRTCVPHCRPILLQLLDATAEAAAAHAAAAAAGPNLAGGPGPATAPAASGMGGMSGGAAAASTAAAAGSAAVLDGSRALLALLLAHGADPLEQDQTTSRQPTTFMTACQHTALLRLAVTHVQRQCQSAPGGAGRRLTTGECQQLLSAGRRAYTDCG